MNKLFIGVNIGSVSVNIVGIDEKGNVHTQKHPHHGNPQEVLQTILYEKFQSTTTYYGICGSFGEISEIAAIQRGIRSYQTNFDGILSLGGEAFVLYILDHTGQVVNVLSHDKCAAGSGEFIIQQLERLHLTLDEAMQYAQKGKNIELASRCSVYTKSDITHKLNRNEASIQDIVTSLFHSMAYKVINLVIQARSPMKRILLIGGVAQNSTFVQILRNSLKDTEICITPESPVFEAYGTSLLVQDDPQSTTLTLAHQHSFSLLPALAQFHDRVNVISPPIELLPTISNNSSPFILGLDVGSTTTKIVLVHPETHAILASFYGRTNGNPVEAARTCIQELINQVGNYPVNLVGVTGSGRDIVAAYLGTAAVLNEISAHSRGAVFFDPEVDTIFEIGGQDSKFLYIEQGVPVDYAMNASCSAGTGSFLEESAKCDLGINVHDISEIALRAEQPVRFKADCAAFINSDIRTALQEGYGRENIIGGLVYSIANNYLTKVKGSRSIGRKIFFQGGVAKNVAVGYAFAQILGRPIIIPPHPELIGAFGIALIAQSKYAQLEIPCMLEDTTLQILIQKPMQALGDFTCKACSNYCIIARYKVGDRQFPFGGRCTRYEHVWKQTQSITEKEDLVAYRNKLIFNTQVPENYAKKATNPRFRLGIPRALLMHSLFHLFSTFFGELGFEVVLSDVDRSMELLPNATFCYPIQILHGAVLDLSKKQVSTIFFPHIYSLEKHPSWEEATFCPIAQASPYIVSSVFPNLTIFRPELDFSRGYAQNQTLIEFVMHTWQIPLEKARDAYLKAVNTQIQIERLIRERGESYLRSVIQSGEIAVVIVGRSYNAFPQETSHSIPKKLVSMGVNVIPFESLEIQSNTPGDFPWYFANYIKEAVQWVKTHENFFLLYIGNFSCTLDAFIQNYVRTELTHKPYLFIELDAHTADAGTQTRLEAFLEIIKNFRHIHTSPVLKPFQITRLSIEDKNPVVTTSSGETLDMKDRRVKLYLPCFSLYHTSILERMFNILGYHFESTTDIELDYSLEGLKFCSGKECIPLPIVMGQILSLVKKRKPGEIIGYFMLRAGSPCVVCQYNQFLEDFIKKNQIPDVFIFNIDAYNHFLGISLVKIIRYATQIIVIGDIVHEIDSAIQVVGNEESLNLLHLYWQEFLNQFTSFRVLSRQLRLLIAKIAQISRNKSPKDVPKVMITGDFFVRFSPFFLHELQKMYAAQGIIVKSTELFELFTYGIPFGTMIKPEVRFQYARIMNRKFKGEEEHSDLGQKTGMYLSRKMLHIMERVNKRLRSRFQLTGLLYADSSNIMHTIQSASELINLLIFGEAILTIGRGVEIANNSDFDALILTGPQYCLPYRISQAILKPYYLDRNRPFLVYDAEISAISPNMRRLIAANIEHIKRIAIK